MNPRTIRLKRNTEETDVHVSLALDGAGVSSIATGIGFLDHMLRAFTQHGRFDLELHASGDLEVDLHHTVEDVGALLGAAFSEALGERAGIGRFGQSILPMDEALAMVAVDLSGRALCTFDAPLSGTIGTFSAELVKEFFGAFARGGALTLHARILCGGNRHHIAEALFKGLGRAMAEATAVDPRTPGVPSTKGSLT